MKNRKIANPKLVAPRRQTSFISRGTSPGRLYGTRGMPPRCPVTFGELFMSRSDLLRAHCLADFQSSFQCHVVCAKPLITGIPLKIDADNCIFLEFHQNTNPKLVAPRRQTLFISRGTTPGRLYGTRGMRTRSPVTLEELFASRSDRFRVHCLADFSLVANIHGIR